MIRSVAVVAKKNNPVFLETYGGDVKTSKALKYHFHIHASLDIVEKRVTTGVGSKGGYTGGRELYLGELYSVEECNLYGYVTNTGMKFIVLLEGSNTQPSLVKAWFRDFHELYTFATANPFFETPKDALHTTTFLAGVKSMVGEFNAKASS